MAHGQSKGKVDDKFSQRIDELERKAYLRSQAFRLQSGTRPWHTPDTMKDNDLLDVPNLHEPAWNRDNLNKLYSDDVLERGGTVADLIGLKRQIDFMAVEERAWRLRHASKTRCLAVAHGRLNGHGLNNASIFSMMRRDIENRIKEGAITGGKK